MQVIVLTLQTLGTALFVGLIVLLWYVYVKVPAKFAFYQDQGIQFSKNCTSILFSLPHFKTHNDYLKTTDEPMSLW